MTLHFLAFIMSSFACYRACVRALPLLCFQHKGNCHINHLIGRQPRNLRPNLPPNLLSNPNPPNPNPKPNQGPDPIHSPNLPSELRLPTSQPRTLRIDNSSRLYQTNLPVIYPELCQQHVPSLSL